jgi:hypothetical protein
LFSGTFPIAEIILGSSRIGVKLKTGLGQGFAARFVYRYSVGFLFSRKPVYETRYESRHGGTTVCQKPHMDTRDKK